MIGTIVVFFALGAVFGAAVAVSFCRPTLFYQPKEP